MEAKHDDDFPVENEHDNSSQKITISVTPTTGGQFNLSITQNDSIETLKKLISKKLQVPKERICLLYRERQLQYGTLQENHVVNGSNVTLLPFVETGMLNPRSELSVIQAVESLGDEQLNDFFTGKAQLALTVRHGGDTLLIQLQLSSISKENLDNLSKENLDNLSNEARSTLNSQLTSTSKKPEPMESEDTTTSSPTMSSTYLGCDTTPLLDSAALAEASWNITRTLKEFSSEVSTPKGGEVDEASNQKKRHSAILLKPAFLDETGKPKRDISTLILMLNDLMCASLPQSRTPEPVASEASSSVPLTSSPSDSVVESDENRVTRGKMEKLRLVLSQRKENKRNMRPQPYSKSK